MSESYYMEIFSKNLRYYMDLNGKNQTDLINDLGFNRSAVSTWVNGTRLPRMDKVDALAKYFGVKRSDLIEEKNHDESTQGYYTNPETARIAQAILDSKELSALFDVSRNMSPEDLTTVYQMALALYRKEHGDD